MKTILKITAALLIVGSIVLGYYVIMNPYNYPKGYGLIGAIILIMMLLSAGFINDAANQIKKY